DTKVFRDAIARHYEQVAVVDAEVGAIIAALKKNDLFESTIVVFFTDHGSPLPREKQNLYEAGLKVPLIFRGPGIPPGKVRKDLVSGIDISSTSLSFLNLRLPKNFEGGDLFDKEYKLREFVIGARDRLGVAIDRVRTVRTDHFRYIRNYHADRPVYQLQYREKYATLKELRKLYAEGGLSPVQAWYHDATQRPREELYDLRSDPYQVKNLAADPSVADELERHRKLLEGWENETGDMGRVPASRDELEAVYKQAKGKVANPEYDFLKK
ncbi:MAG: sulfatase-like hydrolase/transferase, partial [Akkermansiaceae bacterium]